MINFSRILSLFVFLFLSTPAMSQQSYIFNDELDVALIPADWSILKTLRNAGDLRNKKRPVDHFLFPKKVRKANMDEFITRIKKHKGVTKIIILNRKGLHVIYQSNTKAQSIARMIDFLSNEAPKYGYLYDGWGTESIKK